MKSKKYYKFAAVIMLLTLLLIIAPGAFAVTQPVERITDKLICPCGCTMIVSECKCQDAVKITGFVEEKMTGGATDEQILDALVENYGEKILAEPRSEGFGIVAWVTPFIGLAAGGVIVFLLIRNWNLKKQRTNEKADDLSSDVLDDKDDKYREKIEKDLEERD